MSMQDTVVAAPGWYPDPAGSERLRWWSGAGWTEHFAGAVEEPQAPADERAVRADAPAEPEPVDEVTVHPEPISEVPVEPQPVQEVLVEPEPVQEVLVEPEPVDEVAVDVETVVEESTAKKSTDSAPDVTNRVSAGFRRAARRAASDSPTESDAPNTGRSPIASVGSSAADSPTAGRNSVTTDIATATATAPAGALASDPPTPDANAQAAHATPSVDAWWIPVPQSESVATDGPLDTTWTPEPTRTDWRTPQAWGLALLTPIGIAVTLAILVATISQPLLYAVLSLTVSIGTLVAMIVLTLKDRSTLAAKGMTRLPSAWWLLLGPLFYLGARWHAVRSVGGRGAAPFWVAVGANAASAVIATVIAVNILVASGLGAETLSATSLTGRVVDTQGDADYISG